MINFINTIIIKIGQKEGWDLQQKYAFSLKEIQRKVREDSRTLFLNTKLSKLNLDLPGSGEGLTMEFYEYIKKFWIP